MDNIRPNRVKHLICDSGAFIANTPIQDFGENVYSLPEVVAEIKDENTRQRLQFIAYEIKFREPTEEDIKFVVDFAKKTGDYCQLSATDIKVIALTLRLEKEIIGDKNIRSSPDVTKTVGKTETNQSMVGFCGLDKNNAKEAEEHTGSDGESGEEGTDDEEDDSDDGWITPSNVEHIRRQMIGINVDDEVEDEVSVGCMTGDYAMQNVLLQIGLKVINICDGLRIRRTKRFVLRCFACFKISTQNTKEFCNECGNYGTLKRVALTVRDDGTKEVFINFKNPINIRGTRYSLPAPKGGKHSKNPVLVADQQLPQQRKSKFSVEDKKGLNSDRILTDPDYINRTNPFAINDVYSKGSKLQSTFRRRVNPNETRRPTGNRKNRGNK